jgi:hypothetical protein
MQNQFIGACAKSLCAHFEFQLAADDQRLSQESSTQVGILSEGDLWSVADEAAVRRLQTLDGVRGEGLLLAQRHHHRRAVVDVDAASGLTAESVGARLDLCGHALRSRHWGMRV